jgi:hypothetical protein
MLNHRRIAQELADADFDVVGHSMLESIFTEAPVAAAFVPREIDLEDCEYVLHGYEYCSCDKCAEVYPVYPQHVRDRDAAAVKAYKAAEANGTMGDRWSLEDFGYSGPDYGPSYTFGSLPKRSW